MNQKKAKKKRPSKYLVIMSIVLSVLCMVLLVFDVLQCRKANLTLSCKEKEAYLQAVAYSCVFEPEKLVEYIQSQYPTSASDYCFVALDEEIVFFA